MIYSHEERPALNQYFAHLEQARFYNDNQTKINYRGRLYDNKANITSSLLFMSKGLDSKVNTPATKQEKQVTTHVIGQKIPLKGSCGIKRVAVNWTTDEHA